MVILFIILSCRESRGPNSRKSQSSELVLRFANKSVVVKLEPEIDKGRNDNNSSSNDAS